MGNRRKIREYVIKYLYQCEINGCHTYYKDEIDAFLDNFDVDVDLHQTVKTYIQSIFLHFDEINRLIEKVSENWALHRIPLVDRSVLRLGMYEILYCGEIPTAVVINEAIGIGRCFGNEHSQSFINGILDHAARLVRTKDPV